MFTCSPKWTIWCTLVAAVLVDIVATSSLMHYLRKSRTGFPRRVLSSCRMNQSLINSPDFRTDSMVDVLMLYTINTGVTWVLSAFAFLLTFDRVLSGLSTRYSGFRSSRKCRLKSFEQRHHIRCPYMCKSSSSRHMNVA